jgi:hypothetical protein
MVIYASASKKKKQKILGQRNYVIDWLIEVLGVESRAYCIQAFYHWATIPVLWCFTFSYSFFIYWREGICHNIYMEVRRQTTGVKTCTALWLAWWGWQEMKNRYAYRKVGVGWVICSNGNEPAACKVIVTHTAEQEVWLANLDWVG